MKKKVKYIIFSVMILFCLAAAGCNSAKENSSKSEQTESVQNENGAVIAISIFEHGGEDGRVNDWKVYQEDDQYILSYLDRRVYGLNNDTATPEIFEITEQEYSDIMSLDYAEYIREYDAEFWEGVADAIYFDSVITYENGAMESTQAIMTEPTIKLYELLEKYEN